MQHFIVRIKKYKFGFKWYRPVKFRLPVVNLHFKRGAVKGRRLRDFSAQCSAFLLPIQLLLGRARSLKSLFKKTRQVSRSSFLNRLQKLFPRYLLERVTARQILQAAAEIFSTDEAREHIHHNKTFTVGDKMRCPARQIGKPMLWQ